MIPRSPMSTLFPYTTLFRSGVAEPQDHPIRHLAGKLEHPRRKRSHVDREVRTRLETEEVEASGEGLRGRRVLAADRKSTRLNSSHVEISYAVFCLKKKIDIM